MGGSHNEIARTIGELVGPLAWEPGTYLTGGFTAEPGGGEVQ